MNKLTYNQIEKELFKNKIKNFKIVEDEKYGHIVNIYESVYLKNKLNFKIGRVVGNLHINLEQKFSLDGDLLPEKVENLELKNIKGIKNLEIKNIGDTIKIVNCGLKFFPQISPSFNGSLIINHNKIKELKNIKISSLSKSINLSNNQIEKIENCEFWCNHLDINNNKIKKIISLKSNCKNLNLSYNQLEDLKFLENNVENSLKSLIVNNNKIKSLNGLENFEFNTVMLDSNNIKDIDIKLNFEKNQNNILNIGHNQIKQIKNISEDLETLVLLHNQIEKIENLPSKINTVRLDNNLIKEISSDKEIEIFFLNLNNNKINKLYLKNIKVKDLYLCNNAVVEYDIDSLKTLNVLNIQDKEMYKNDLNSFIHSVNLKSKIKLNIINQINKTNKI